MDYAKNKKCYKKNWGKIMSKRKIGVILSLTTLLVSGCTTTKPHTELDTAQVSPAQSDQAKTNQATQVGRYVTVEDQAHDDQVNPLLAIGIFDFPTSIQTVGQAVNHVLLSSGYQLSHELSSDVKNTLAMQLPITNRHLGPLPITMLLEVLMGSDVYQLQIDPLHRLVNFQIKPDMQRTLGIQ
jgi:conjugative transfer region protein (TIGR03748 family)